MRQITFGFSALRRAVAAGVMALVLAAGFTAPAAAASPAEQFVNDNLQKGLGILTNKALSKDQRRDQFQDFLLSLADLKAIANYTLGQYRRGASPADITAYETAYKEYALAVYRTYFDKFSGQTLKVIGSYPLSGGEVVVKTVMYDPAKTTSGKPPVINFRLAPQGQKFLATDISFEGVWLRQTQRDDFTSFLGQNNGDIKALIGVLKNKTKQEQLHAR